MPSQTNTVSLRTVRHQIARQHAEIRARLRGLERTITAAGRRDALAHLRLSLGHFAAFFDAHLALEERHLGPILRELDTWGPAREAALLEEHIEQRQRCEALTALADVTPSLNAELRGEVRWLLQTLSEDMDREDAELAKLEQLDADGAEQMTG